MNNSNSNNYTHQYQYSNNSMSTSHSSHSSPLSTTSSLLVSSPLSSNSTISQHYSSKGFDYDDDFQYVPDLIMQQQYVQQQQYYGNSHHHYNHHSYYTTNNVITAHNTGGSGYNSVSSSPSNSYGNSMNVPPQTGGVAATASFKFNPYKSLTFSPKTSPRKLDLNGPNNAAQQHAAVANKHGGKIEIIDPSTGMSVLSASGK